LPAGRQACVLAALRALDSLSDGPECCITAGELVAAYGECGHSFGTYHELVNHALVVAGLCAGGKYLISLAFGGPTPDAAVLKVVRNPPGSTGRPL